MLFACMTMKSRGVVQASPDQDSGSVSLQISATSELPPELIHMTASSTDLGIELRIFVSFIVFGSKYDLLLLVTRRRPQKSGGAQ